jgi:two-component system, LytTR family, sensor kinase
MQNQPSSVVSYKWAYFLVIPLTAILLTLLWDYIILDATSLNDTMRKILIGIIDTTVIWLGCMAIVGYLWKKFPWEQKPVLHLLIEIPAIITYTIVFGYFVTYQLLIKIGLLKPEEINVGVEITISILITLLITSLHEAYFFYRQWKLNFSKSVKLQKDNINAKYEALKAQINPHFLFNSLNSLVSIVDGNVPASRYIMDLSDFLRYMLKSREREVVLLREEYEILEKYANLQKTRFGENLKININIGENYFHFALPPLVLQMLVENCIKHNIISKDKPLVVSIYVKDHCIVVENNLQSRDGVSSTGNGLRNITERYAYLTAKNVEIKQTNGKFTVSVPLVMVDL